MPLLRDRRLPALLLLLAVAAVLLALHPWSRTSAVRVAAVACETTPVGKDADVAPAKDADAAAGKDADAEDPDAAKRAGGSAASLYAGPGEAKGQAPEGGPCGHRHPESFRDLALANSSQASRSVAPGTQLRAGAYRSSITQRAALTTAESRAAVNGTGGQWSPYGNSPVETGRTEYDTTRGSTQ